MKLVVRDVSALLNVSEKTVYQWIARRIFVFNATGKPFITWKYPWDTQHRGIERALLGGPGPRALHYMETLAGDSTIGHGSAYCAEEVRAIAAELERMANHIADFGRWLAMWFLPTSNYCGRIRGDVLNMTALICGNRFGRGLLRPGGSRNIEP